MELGNEQRDVLQYLANGGLIAFRAYNKKTKIVCQPDCARVGLGTIATLDEAELIRPGEASPYRTGKSYSILLTNLGKTEAAKPLPVVAT
jgi:hypothetical protein